MRARRLGGWAREKQAGVTFVRAGPDSRGLVWNSRGPTWPDGHASTSLASRSRGLVMAAEPESAMRGGCGTGKSADSACGAWLPCAAMDTALVIGFGAGALVAAQLGPVTLLLVRTVLRGAVVAGMAFGGAVALVDLLYAAAGLAGAGALLTIEPLRLTFGIIGAVVLW